MVREARAWHFFLCTLSSSWHLEKVRMFKLALLEMVPLTTMQASHLLLPQPWACGQCLLVCGSVPREMGNARVKSLLSAIFSLVIFSVWIQHCLCPWQEPWCCPGAEPGSRARLALPGHPLSPALNAAGRGLVAQSRAPSLPASSGLLECRGPAAEGILRPGGEEVLVRGSLENSCFLA